MVRIEQVDQMTFERHGNVGVWTIKSLNQLFEDETEEEKAAQHYQEVAGEEQMTSTVVVIEDYESLDAETQEYISEAWSRLAEEAGIEKSAYVADGIGGMAVESNIETQTVQSESFKSTDEAIAWASNNG